LGIALDVVPSYFGWELVVWKTLEQQSRVEIEKKSAEVFGEIHDVEVRDDTSEEEKSS